MNKIRAKMTLATSQTSYMVLKRWAKEEGFYIEHISYYQGNFPEIEAKGLTLKECFMNYETEGIYSKKNMFSKSLSNMIIDIFELSNEDIEFITDLGERGDF